MVLLVENEKVPASVIFPIKVVQLQACSDGLAIVHKALTPPAHSITRSGITTHVILGGLSSLQFECLHLFFVVVVVVLRHISELTSLANVDVCLLLAFASKNLPNI